MYRQKRLFEEKENEDINLEEKPSEVKVVRNRFLTPGAVVVEEIIRKRWIKPISY